MLLVTLTHVVDVLKVWHDRNGAKIIHSYVPLAEMFGYSTDLRSRTQGRGNYVMEVDHYEPCPKNIQEKVLAGRKSAE